MHRKKHVISTIWRSSLNRDSRPYHLPVVNSIPSRLASSQKHADSTPHVYADSTPHVNIGADADSTPHVNIGADDIQEKIG